MSMAKRKFHLTKEQARELLDAYTREKDGPTRTRYLAVRLYATGYPVQEILNITGCSRSSLMGWCRTYGTQGMDGLVDKRAGGNRARLTTEQIGDLHDRLHGYTPADLFGPQAGTADGQFWTVIDLQRVVQEWYGVNFRSRTSYLRLLDLCEFSYQRPAKVYKSRRERDVTAFEEQLEKNS
jgi:transposase